MRHWTNSSLLMRLTDDTLEPKMDASAQADVGQVQMRQAVVGDLSLLFNTPPLGSSVDLEPYPHVRASTLNYGIDCRTGVDAESIDSDALRSEIALALQIFEPRFVQDSLDVSLLEDSTADSLHFRIEADLIAAPRPIRMVMRTEHDRRSTSVRVVELTKDPR